MSTPRIDFEDSPVDSLADSFVSTPGTQHPFRFDNMDSMAPNEAMTPESYHEDDMYGDLMNRSLAGASAPEKMPSKKRKSWGQQLPKPKTNLPPRKRAKTEDEKEQRRVERVLRNRRAAQSSRERKRQEVEALVAEKRAVSQRNQDLDLRLAVMEARTATLQRELEQFTGTTTVFHGNSPASSQTEKYHRAPTRVTLSRDLFSPQDENRFWISHQSIIDTQPSPTVDPSSLSLSTPPSQCATRCQVQRQFFRHDTTSCRDVVRPALSVGGTEALDSFDFASDSHLVNKALYHLYFDAPWPTESDRQLFENVVLGRTFDPLVVNDNSFDELHDIYEFLHHDKHNRPGH